MSARLAQAGAATAPPDDETNGVAMSEKPTLALHESAQRRPLPDVLRDAGIAGCGGAGFPTFAKYAEPLPVHVTNAQESEPGYYIDKWLHKHRAREFHELYDHLLAWGTKKIVVGAKMKDRPWFEELEQRTGATVLDCTGRNRHDLGAIENPYVFAYTDDRYAFGKETALLLVVAQAKIPPGERPGQHGFIVNNSQTLLNMHSALTTGSPVTRKYVHVYGETPRHIFVEAPVGTLAEDLLAAAGTSLDEVKARGLVAVEGGPGWFHRIDLDRWALNRRTNSLLLIDPAYRDPDGKDVLANRGTPGYPKEAEDEHAQSPSSLPGPARVRLALVDNPELAAVRPAVPIVGAGDRVEVGQRVADPAAEGISLPVHASLAGEVTEVGEGFLEIRA